MKFKFDYVLYRFITLRCQEYMVMFSQAHQRMGIVLSTGQEALTSDYWVLRIMERG